MASRARLLVVSGPSGVGKGTVVAALAGMCEDIVVAVSATTRPPRPGEVDGVHYRFLDDHEFDSLVAAGGFLEWAEYNGHRYGTPWSSVHQTPASERTTLVLEIDVQGAREVRARFPDAVLVLLVPPSMRELEARIRRRGVHDEAEVARRLAIAERELAQAEFFDHLVVNAQVGRCVQEIGRIVGCGWEHPSTPGPDAGADPPLPRSMT
jgi:guanylate kinase